MTAAAAGFTVGGIAQAIKGLYGVVGDVNDFINKHIEEMKSSANSTISRTGRVIDGAKYGFGLGYTVPIAIIAVGQMLLGNTFLAMSTVATAVTLSNPIAMTCAAVGAIYYGWQALSDTERQDILDKIGHALEVGVELIRSVIGFVINSTKELLTSDNAIELKQFIAGAAQSFGRTLADVTGSIADRIKGAFDVVAKTSSDAVDRTRDVASNVYIAATDTAGKVVDAVKDKFDKSGPK